MEFIFSFFKSKRNRSEWAIYPRKKKWLQMKVIVIWDIVTSEKKKKNKQKLQQDN